MCLYGFIELVKQICTVYFNKVLLCLNSDASRLTLYTHLFVEVVDSHEGRIFSLSSYKVSIYNNFKNVLPVCISNDHILVLENMFYYP